MNPPSFRVQCIDHVEFYVPDQYAAAKWYQQVLGFEILPGYECWAESGPLMISSDGGATKLALFKGEPPGQRPIVGFRRLAFRVDGAGFLAFLKRAASAPLYNEDGQVVHELKAVDHDLAWSVYFCDPYGNRLEVTTYDYEAAAAHTKPW